ncbi:MAG TPA: FliA/WhiG family RNA polymerase sigma factor [Gammaproteobacteria bacterium]|jgi:RNA polymerase sigma factor for flagellar operon FliA|nr:FliA/WhiG family RNA polymerase sigma factor [Gammaproteobacteria bacterium]|tara:strand:+ start:26494 stop:27192 length:699 start_codon:yes stop_codon:yes gene_type:complete
MADIDAYKRQQQDSAAVTEHYTMVKRIAYHLKARLPSHIVLDDLVQAGMEGLLQARNAFDESRGIEFEGFAKSRVRGAMLDEVRRTSFSTRSVISFKKEHDKAISTLAKQLGREPKSSEVASFLDKDLATYEQERVLAEGADIVSTDAHEGFFEEEDDLAKSPEQMLERNQLIGGLADAIEELPERAQMVLALYYQEELNLKEIGAVLSVSESRVSQILSETAGKLRRLMGR